MHFNDLISRLRFQALAGVAGLSASIVLLADRLAGGGRSSSMLAAVAFLALAALWTALWVLDFVYYNRLLLGAVEEIVKVERESQSQKTLEKLGFSETVKGVVEAPVSLWNTPWRKSQRGPRLFYQIVLATLLLLSLGSYLSPGLRSSTNESLPGPGVQGNPGTPPKSPN
jgi:hypothetical protein